MSSLDAKETNSYIKDNIRLVVVDKHYARCLSQYKNTAGRNNCIKQFGTFVAIHNFGVTLFPRTL